MGFGHEGNSINIWDGDTLEEENCAGGFFSEQHIGMQKTTALKNLIGNINSAVINEYPENYIDREILDPVVILCLDSVEERIRIVNSIIKNSPDVQLIVDSRSGWHQGQVILLDPKDKKQIKSWLNTLRPEVVEELPCGAKAVAYNPVTISGFVGSVLRNFFTGQPIPKSFLVLHNAHFYEVML